MAWNNERERKIIIFIEWLLLFKSKESKQVVQNMKKKKNCGHLNGRHWFLLPTAFHQTERNIRTYNKNGIYEYAAFKLVKSTSKIKMNHQVAKNTQNNRCVERQRVFSMVSTQILLYSVSVLVCRFFFFFSFIVVFVVAAAVRVWRVLPWQCMCAAIITSLNMCETL